ALHEGSWLALGSEIVDYYRTEATAPDTARSAWRILPPQPEPAPYGHDEASMATWLTGLEIVLPGICEARAWAAGAIKTA
ncbi:MAG: hypothetical protein ACRDN0_29845, partial [Trebonia sp.]